MFFVGAVDLIAPHASALIEIRPIGKLSSGQEVPFNERKGSFHPAGTIGVPYLMGTELEAEVLPEGDHLRYGDHRGTAPPQHDDMGVVDHHPTTGASKVAQGFGEKHLAIEALKGRETLEEQETRITQHGGGGLHRAPLPGHF